MYMFLNIGGDPLDHDPEQGSSKRLFNGLCQVLIVPTGGSGTIRLSASSGGLASAILEMDVREIQEIVIRSNSTGMRTTALHG